ncbi:MAG: hypothetical protein JO172_06415 [Hyphomicrobiales bacterium]|nr:hypothetical protein [Hyphomicrobiales bacterium]
MPDELGAPVTTTSGPDGQPALMLVPLWNGDKLHGQRAVGQLQALGKPQLAQIGPMTYTDMLGPIDTQLAELAGCPWETRTRSLRALMPAAIDAIIRAVARRTSPHSMVYWHYFHGAATRIPAEAIAFGLRREHFMVEIIAAWEADADDGAAQAGRGDAGCITADQITTSAGLLPFDLIY